MALIVISLQNKLVRQCCIECNAVLAPACSSSVYTRWGSQNSSMLVQKLVSELKLPVATTFPASSKRGR